MTTKELRKLSNNVGEAIFAYHNAVAENLKESGKEHELFRECDDDKGVRITMMNDNCDGVVDLVIDKVRYNDDNGQVEIHICEYDYNESDEWDYASSLTDSVDYVFDSIMWDD